MFGLFKKKNDKVLGVDIDHTSLSLLELKKKDKGFLLNAYAHKTIPLYQPSAHNTGDEHVMDLQREHLYELISRNKYAVQNTVTAVSTANVIMKKISVEASLTEEEIENQVILEAEQLIPYPIEEVALDFEVLGMDEKNEEKKQVVLVACRKNLIQDIENLLHLSGATPNIVEVVHCALERAYPLLRQDSNVPQDAQCVSLLHCGESFITLNIMQGEQNIYTGSIPFASYQIVEEIIQSTGCTQEQAWQYYTTQNFPKECKDLIYERMVLQQNNQINRLFEQFFATNGGISIDHIILSGSALELQELANKITETMHITCTLANPFHDMKLGKKINREDLNKQAPALTVACGLAMREGL